MDYYTRLNNQTENRPLLHATAADLEIERLHDIIKAMVQTIEELQEAINQMALNLGPVSVPEKPEDL